MSLKEFIVELSDTEIAILEKLANNYEISLNAALRKSILQAGYLLQSSEKSKELFIGKLDRGMITKNSGMTVVNLDRVFVSKKQRAD